MLVRYKSGKTTLEVVTKEGAATKYREGNLSSVDDVVVSRDVFSNYGKGERASTDQLKSAFDTEDMTAVLDAILKKGTIQVGASERKEKAEKKRAEVVQYLHKYYVEPKTHRPIPPGRLDSALTEAKVRIDTEQEVERQVQAITQKLLGILPMKKLTLELTLTVPHRHLGSAGNVIARYFEVARETYDSEGCRMEVSVIPGDYDTAVKDLAKATKGEFTMDVDGQSAANAAATTSEPVSGGKKSKKGKKGR